MKSWGYQRRLHQLSTSSLCILVNYGDAIKRTRKAGFSHLMLAISFFYKKVDYVDDILVKPFRAQVTQARKV
jgi:hypothetical protein